jgi:serine/threonine-protein kinase RsbW
MPLSDHQPGLLIRLPARPENVAVVRHAVAGLAEELGMEAVVVGDLKTIVTEACMNVVVHAYGGEAGPLQVEVAREGEELTICVRDLGEGIRPRPDLERPSLRLGLTLIAALSSSFEISGGLHRGTEVRMHMPLRGVSGNGRAKGAAKDVEIEGAELTIASPEIVAPVLGRVLGAMAARRRITVDRINDAMLFTDALSEQAPQAFVDRRFCFAVAEDNAGVELRVGPMPRGASELLRKGLDLPEVGGSLESLPDEVRVEEGEAGEYLVARFAGLAS